MERSDLDYALSLHFLLNGEHLQINQVVNEIEVPEKDELEMIESIEVRFFKFKSLIKQLICCIT